MIQYDGTQMLDNFFVTKERTDWGSGETSGTRLGASFSSMEVIQGRRNAH
jgi:hypothetical protein